MENLPADYFLTSQQFTPHNRTALYPSIDPTNPANSLAGKVAIITGASRGLGGEGLVPVFAKAGVKGLVLVATNAEKLKSIESSVKKEHPQIETLVIAADVSDSASVDSLFAQVKAKFGHANILVNNAAVLTGGGLVHEEDPSNWWKNFEVNAMGSFLLVRSFIGALPEPTSTPASIVNIATGAWIAVPSMSGYLLSKLAALQLSTHIGVAYPNITSVALNPGLMDTGMILDMFRPFHQDTPEFVASVALWLTSEQAKFLSGRLVVVNWDVDELVEKKGEILEKDLLKIKFGADLGAEHFQ